MSNYLIFFYHFYYIELFYAENIPKLILKQKLKTCLYKRTKNECDIIDPYAHTAKGALQRK